MSSFPQHRDNINDLNEMGFDVSSAIEDGEVTLESWGYDELVDLFTVVISQLKSKRFHVDAP